MLDLLNQETAPSEYNSILVYNHTCKLRSALTLFVTKRAVNITPLRAKRQLILIISYMVYYMWNVRKAVEDLTTNTYT